MANGFRYTGVILGGQRHFFSPAAQLSTTTIGAGPVSLLVAGGRGIRKRWPSA
jgi:hypothetical protein